MCSPKKAVDRLLYDRDVSDLNRAVLHGHFRQAMHRVQAEAIRVLKKEIVDGRIDRDSGIVAISAIRGMELR